MKSNPSVSFVIRVFSRLIVSPILKQANARTAPANPTQPQSSVVVNPRSAARAPAISSATAPASGTSSVPPGQQAHQRLVEPKKASERREQEEQQDEEAEAQEPQTLGAVGIADQDGILITQVIPGGPAETAGLIVGDILIAIDGKRIVKVAEESELMTGKKTGQRF